MGEGFPLWSLASMAWEGRPSEIGSVSLPLSVSVLLDSALSQFLIFPEIRNSDWIETFHTICFRILAFCGERRAPTTLLGGHKTPGRALGRGALPGLVGPS